MNFLIEEKDDDKTKQYIAQQKNLCNEIKNLTDKIKLKIEKIEKNTEAKNTQTENKKGNVFIDPTPAGVTGSRMDRNTIQWSGSLRRWWL